MIHRTLGKTDIRVSPVAMGTWPISGMTSLAVNDADSLATPLVQTSQLLHRLRYYLETSWEDEKEDADVLIAEVHKLESNNVVRKMVGECFDLALPKLKKKPVNDLVALIIQRRNIVRSIRLGRVDDPPLKPEKIK